MQVEDATLAVERVREPHYQAVRFRGDGGAKGDEQRAVAGGADGHVVEILPRGPAAGKTSCVAWVTA